MPVPTGTFQRPDLGTAFSQFPDYKAMGFVATEVLPVLPVPLQSANFSVIKVEALLRLEDLRRSHGAGYNRAEYEFQQSSFSTVEYGLEEVIDDRTRALYMYSFDAERYARDRLLFRLMTNLEIQTATAVQNTANLGGNAAAAALWSAASSDPITDVRAALIQLRANAGYNPSDACMVIDWEAFQMLKDNAAIIDRVKYAGVSMGVEVVKARITPQVIAEALDIKEIIVAGAIKNTADRGQTRSLAAIWDKTKAVLFHRANGDIQAPGLGHIVSWNEDAASPEGTFEEYREEQIRSQVLRCRSDFQAFVKYTQAGYAITGILA